MNLDAGSILVIIGLLVLNLLLAVIFLPYRIVHKIEVLAALERALTLGGLILGIVGLLVSRISGP